MLASADALHDAALYESHPDPAADRGGSREPDLDAAVDVPVDDLAEDLCAAAVHAADALDVEDDVDGAGALVAQARETGVRARVAVPLESPETVLELAGVGKRECLRHLDDQTPFHVFELGGRDFFGRLERVRSGYAAENLDSCAGGVADDLDERDANADRDAGFERPDNGREEDEEHRG